MSILRKECLRIADAEALKEYRARLKALPESEHDQLREQNKELVEALRDIAAQSHGHHLNAEVKALAVYFGDKARAVLAKIT